jgi:1-aminocyclopropane-1-carboxylate deaminase/D-cysteine desulfhydrase-like pyridoxal-dependent ACC family enzyme
VESILFEVYPGLRQMPWQSLGDFPTPVRRLENLGKRLGYQNIWMKEDGKSSNYYGGNKVRKLEFVLPDAVHKKKKTIMTYGGIGTNHGLATTIHGNRLGLKTLLLLVDQPLSTHVQEHLLLFQHFGAELCYAQNRTGAVLKSIWYFLSKRHLYYLPTGGSSPRGSLGFVAAAFELKRQIDAGLLPQPKYIFVALGSRGTMAGLLLGAKLAGLNSIIAGVRVTNLWSANEKTVASLANKTADLMRKYDEKVPLTRFSSADTHVLHDFFGEGYGAPTPEGREAVEIMQQTEATNLDLTYTAKAFAALLHFVRTEKGHEDVPILFWNTYNSVDLTPIIKEDHDYRKLPEPFHKFFSTNLIPYIQ